MNPIKLPHQPGSQAKAPSPPPFSLTYLGKTRSNSNQQANQLLQTQENKYDFKPYSTYFSATKNGPKKSPPSPYPFIDQSGKPYASNPPFLAQESDKKLRNTVIFKTKSRNPTFFKHLNKSTGPINTTKDINKDNNDKKDNSDNDNSISYVSVPTFTNNNRTSEEEEDNQHYGLQFKKFNKHIIQHPVKQPPKPTANTDKSSIKLKHIDSALALTNIISKYAPENLQGPLFDIQVNITTFLNHSKLFLTKEGSHEPPNFPHASLQQLHELNIGSHELLSHRIQLHCLCISAEHPLTSIFDPRPITTEQWPDPKLDESHKKQESKVDCHPYIDQQKKNEDLPANLVEDKNSDPNHTQRATVEQYGDRTGTPEIRYITPLCTKTASQSPTQKVIPACRPDCHLQFNKHDSSKCLEGKSPGQTPPPKDTPKNFYSPILTLPPSTQQFVSDTEPTTKNHTALRASSNTNPRTFSTKMRPSPFQPFIHPQINQELRNYMTPRNETSNNYDKHYEQDIHQVSASPSTQKRSISTIFQQNTKSQPSSPFHSIATHSPPVTPPTSTTAEETSENESNSTLHFQILHAHSTSNDQTISCNKTPNFYELPLSFDAKTNEEIPENCASLACKLFAIHFEIFDPFENPCDALEMLRDYLLHQFLLPENSADHREELTILIRLINSTAHAIATTFPQYIYDDPYVGGIPERNFNILTYDKKTCQNTVENSLLCALRILQLFRLFEMTYPTTKDTFFGQISPIGSLQSCTSRAIFLRTAFAFFETQQENDIFFEAPSCLAFLPQDLLPSTWFKAKYSILFPPFNNEREMATNVSIQLNRSLFQSETRYQFWFQNFSMNPSREITPSLNEIIQHHHSFLTKTFYEYILVLLESKHSDTNCNRALLQPLPPYFFNSKFLSAQITITLPSSAVLDTYYLLRPNQQESGDNLIAVGAVVCAPSAYYTIQGIELSENNIMRMNSTHSAPLRADAPNHSTDFLPAQAYHMLHYRSHTIFSHPRHLRNFATLL